ncbi:MAG: dual specificity protein phosphatase family protein, partial [Planctomycetaceae bacterium]|nr:dual specificity protein phosphatase family protein [Planctomycetaceae bacterium]
APAMEQLEKTVDFIRTHAENGVVYIHCKIGYSRSASVVGAYLLAENLADSPEAAIQHLRTIRPSIVIRPEAEQAIFEYDSYRKN